MKLISEKVRDYIFKKSLAIIKNQGVKIFLIKVINFLCERYNKISDIRPFLLRIFLKRKIKKLQAFQSTKPQVQFILSDSHKEETLEEVKKILNGNQLDFIFIDGDHSYEGVKKRFSNVFTIS